MSPSPLPVLADPGFGEGMEYLEPRIRCWKLGLRWTCNTGAFLEAFGDEIVTVARKREGLPQEGQNFLD